MIVCEHIKAKGAPEFTPLYTHLRYVALTIEKIANTLGFDAEIAKSGAILHDIGKVSPIFQERIKKGYIQKNSDNTYRHELASLFFLSIFPKHIHPQLIEMIVGHHKSVKNDAREKGILDLENNIEDVFALHIKYWEDWFEDALKIINSFGIQTHKISRTEAEDNYYKAVDYVNNNIKRQGYSKWKGLLMSSDYFASALIDSTENHLSRLFQVPNLSFYNRESQLYPLSLISANSKKRHTIVVASTGAGKTDFLLRRCKNRVFYTLPFQASINAMYKRIGRELKRTNPNLDIRVLHSSSTIISKGKEEKTMQGLIGSSIKVLTPHQIAGIIFGTRSFEANIIDLEGNDIILDEIHTYTKVSRAIVLKIIQVLNNLKCNIHIGTATMPTDLYQKIIKILGEENVYQVKLPEKELYKFDRHIVKKIESWEDSHSIIKHAIKQNQKILIVCNRVKTAQQQYLQLKKEYRDIPLLLIHSRFKREDRNIKEKKLLGINEKGDKTYQFNTSENTCIVVATQIVEVSLDISFDIMITETAPLDSMIQRFGRINRKRAKTLNKTYKPVFIIQPPEDKKTAKPYDLDILKKSYQVLPDNEILHEKDLQQLIDKVFPKIDVMNIETHSIFKQDGTINIDYLTHRPKSYLLEMLEIDSVSCILDTEVEKYEKANFEERMMMEIPSRYWSVKEFKQTEYGNRPFIIPYDAYNSETGLEIEKAKINYEFL